MFQIWLYFQSVYSYFRFVRESQQNNFGSQLILQCPKLKLLLSNCNLLLVASCLHNWISNWNARVWSSSWWWCWSCCFCLPTDWSRVIEVPSFNWWPIVFPNFITLSLSHCFGFYPAIVARVRTMFTTHISAMTETPS